MKLDISEKNYILPAMYVGKKETFRIVNHDNTKDCLLETKKPLNNGKGEYSQYEIALQNEHGEFKNARFLMSQQIKPLVVSLGQDTESWLGQFIELTGEPDGDKNQYFKLHLSHISNPTWSEENVN